MNSIRKDTISGLIEYTDMGSDVNHYLHFSEWTNGEGMDFVIDHMERNERSISLSLDDIAALVTACIASGFVDVKECKQAAKEMNAASKKREEIMEEIRNKNND